MKVGFAGLSHLGIVSGICAASKGVDVVGFDLDPKVINALECKRLPILEPDLDDLFQKASGHLHFTSKLEDLDDCDLVYISLDIKTNDENVSDLQPIKNLIQKVGAHLKSQKMPMVILSQIPPGFTREVDFPVDRLFYQVETLIFGRAVERALRPERYMIGCANPQTPLPKSFLEFLNKYDCPVLPMRFESAELCKISINLFLASSVTMTNTLAELCESVGADWREIAPALRMDKRIGPHAYLSPGLGLSGGNIERDVASVLKMAKANGTEASAAQAITDNSAYRKAWPQRMVRRHLLKDNPAGKVAVWGLAYKEDTKSTKNSPSLELLKALGQTNIQVFDPQATLPEELKNSSWKEVKSAYQACEGADALVVMTPWAEFKKLDLKEVKLRMGGNLIIDPLFVLDQVACREAGFKFLTMGQPE